MDFSKINKAAKILYKSRINLQRIKELPKDCIPKSLEGSYAIQNQLTNSQEDCTYNGSLDLTRKQKCIISAIINLTNSLQMLDNTTKLSSILINCVGSIILGKTYTRNISKADTNIFEEIDQN